MLQRTNARLSLGADFSRVGCGASIRVYVALRPITINDPPNGRFIARPNLYSTTVAAPSSEFTGRQGIPGGLGFEPSTDRKSTRLNSSHVSISYAVFCL